MKIPAILITGANGQVGSELKALAKSYPQFNFIFTTREELSIENTKALENLLSRNNPEYLINTAAYTAVDIAESEKEKVQKMKIAILNSLQKADSLFKK